MAQYASEKLLALDKKEGNPLELLVDICTTLDIPFERPLIKEGQNVAYEHKGIKLDPFIEPNAIIFNTAYSFPHNLIDDTLIIFEQLSKIVGFAGRVQSNKLSVDISAVPQPTVQESRQIELSGWFRILLNVGTYEQLQTLRILFESCPNGPGRRGSSSISFKLPNYLPIPQEREETVEVITKMTGVGFTIKVEGRISVWHW